MSKCMELIEQIVAGDCDMDVMVETLEAAIQEVVISKPFVGELTSGVCQVGQCPHRQREAMNLVPSEPESLS